MLRCSLLGGMRNFWGQMTGYWDRMMDGVDVAEDDFLIFCYCCTW